MGTANSHIFSSIVHAYPCRPLGSDANAGLLAFMDGFFRDAGLEAISLPFDCAFWTYGASSLQIAGKDYPILTGPFSPPVSGAGRVLRIRTVEELVAADMKDAILLLHGELAAEALMSKDFPFYYPDEHKRIIDTLETGAPTAVIAVTGQDPMSGQNPFPMFEDGNFRLPSGYTGDLGILAACRDGDLGTVTIVSALEMRASRQLIGRRAGASQGRIVVCAHMDTKYGTPGAIDNTAGVAVLLELAQRSAELRDDCVIDIVPFNGEENYAVPGQLKYLALLSEEAANVRLVINLDAPGCVGAQNVFSLYNFSDAQRAAATEIIAGSEQAALGGEWYASDHTMFVYAGTPAIAITSFGPAGEVSRLIHTERDAPEVVDPRLLSCACDAVIRLINGLKV